MSFRIALAGVLLAMAAGCGGYGTSPSPTPSSGGTNDNGSPVSIVSGADRKTTDAYAPNPITVAVGGSVTWTNNDSTAHTSSSDGGLWTSGTLAPGKSFSYKFQAAGTYTYHCQIHPNMVGTVTVQ